jgi:hypothetical protein
MEGALRLTLWLTLACYTAFVQDLRAGTLYDLFWNPPPVTINANYQTASGFGQTDGTTFNFSVTEISDGLVDTWTWNTADLTCLYIGGTNDILFQTDKVTPVGSTTSGLTSALPLTGTVGWGQINVQDYNPPPGQELQVDIRTASSDYFRTMRIPLVEGRFFSDSDRIGSQKVAIIDENFARRFWPHDNPVGKRLWFNPKSPFTMLVLRTSGEPGNLARPAMAEVHALDPNVLVSEIQTMQELVYHSLSRQRFATGMLIAFAALALLLSIVGVYGVLAYLSVPEQT